MKTLSDLLWWHWLTVVLVFIGATVPWLWAERRKKKDGKGYEKRNWGDWRALGANFLVSWFIAGLILIVLFFLLIRHHR